MKTYLFIILTLLMLFSLHADPPNWQVIGGTQYSMVVMAEVNHNSNVFANENGNMIGAFGPGGENDCRAIGYWQPANPPHHEGFWYLTVVGNESASENLPISFKIYDAIEDDIFSCEEIITFANNTTIGSPSALFVLTTEVFEFGILSGTINLHSGDGNLEDVVIQANSYSTNSNEQGDYSISLPENMYSVSASLEGYVSQTIENVQVVSGQTTPNINFTLYPNQNVTILLPETASGTPNEQTILPIELFNPDSIGIEGIMMEIEVNPEILDVSNVTLENTVLETQDYQYQLNSENGTISLWIYSTGSLFSGDGNILNMTLFILPDAVEGSQTTVTIIQASVNEIEAISNSCNVSILGYYDVSGSIQYFNNELPIPNADVSLIGSDNNSAATSTGGMYQIASNPAGNYFSSATKSDDLGGLSSLDASRIARFGVGLYELDCYQYIAADVTLNGEITATDASRVARYGIGLIENFNSLQKQWVFVAGEVENCSEWPPIEYEANYQYNPLTADETNQDFVGIRLGDVTGNWQQDSRIGDRNLQVNLPDMDAEQGSTISVPMQVENLVDLEGMDIKIHYNDSILQAVSANLDDTILEDNNFAYQVNVSEPNTVIIWLYSQAQPFSGSGNLMNVEFEVTGNVNEVSELNFVELNINEENYLANTTDGSITVIASDSDESALSIEKSTLIGNYPNPFNPETTVRFYLESSTPVTLSIYNVKGQLVRDISFKELGIGAHSIVWDGKDAQQKELSSGIYLYQLQTDHFSDTKRCLLIK